MEPGLISQFGSDPLQFLDLILRQSVVVVTTACRGEDKKTRKNGGYVTRFHAPVLLTSFTMAA